MLTLGPWLEPPPATVDHVRPPDEHVLFVRHVTRPATGEQRHRDGAVNVDRERDVPDPPAEPGLGRLRWAVLDQPHTFSERAIHHRLTVEDRAAAARTDEAVAG